MKKFLFFSLLALILSACSSGDDEPKLYSAIVNITFDGASASPSVAYMYKYDLAKDFDKSYDAMCKFGEERILRNVNGDVIEPAYISPTTIGVNTFENIEKGKYIVVAMYKQSGFSWPFHYYYGYSELNVDHNLPMITFKFVSSSKRGEFIKF